VDLSPILTPCLHRLVSLKLEPRSLPSSILLSLPKALLVTLPQPRTLFLRVFLHLFFRTYYLWFPISTLSPYHQHILHILQHLPSCLPWQKLRRVTLICEVIGVSNVLRGKVKGSLREPTQQTPFRLDWSLANGSRLSWPWLRHVIFIMDASISLISSRRTNTSFWRNCHFWQNQSLSRHHMVLW